MASRTYANAQPHVAIGPVFLLAGIAQRRGNVSPVITRRAI
jgi:hypothetical protein